MQRRLFALLVQSLLDSASKTASQSTYRDFSWVAVSRPTLEPTLEYASTWHTKPSSAWERP